ncbi:nicotinate-nucleotide--dimethylbenzimidazole phosphoribosyltransferase [Streptomyces sp. bgisy022]|uniref:nicotinate-nucleotide--dimethylbenzimidazole phosphoribosyltransferase n=1 Tax=Streptomyces sp. bgisy022 TaxID=3413769 RepID=UPI003D7321CA
MTDTGQVPGEGQPENAGTVEQQGVQAPGAYTYLSEHSVVEEDLLLPGAQGAWGNEVAPPPPEPVVETVHEPEPHETDGRDSGSVDLGGVRPPDPAQQRTPGHAAPHEQAAPAAPRRPLHLGPPIPTPSASPVRSLADRGPADVPARHAGPATVGPEYLDVPRSPEAAPQGGAPWAAQAPVPVGATPVGTPHPPAAAVAPTAAVPGETWQQGTQPGEGTEAGAAPAPDAGAPAGSGVAPAGDTAPEPDPSAGGVPAPDGPEAAGPPVPDTGPGATADGADGTGAGEAGDEDHGAPATEREATQEPVQDAPADSTAPAGDGQAPAPAGVAGAAPEAEPAPAVPAPEAPADGAPAQPSDAEDVVAADSAPEEGAASTEPAASGESAASTEPAVSTEPAAPGESAVPAQPAAPDEPVMPAEPVAPAVPVEPLAPSAAEGPSVRTEPAQGPEAAVTAPEAGVAVSEAPVTPAAPEAAHHDPAAPDAVQATDPAAPDATPTPDPAGPTPATTPGGSGTAASDPAAAADPAPQAPGADAPQPGPHAGEPAAPADASAPVEAVPAAAPAAEGAAAPAPGATAPDPGVPHPDPAPLPEPTVSGADVQDATAPAAGQPVTPVPAVTDVPLPQEDGVPAAADAGQDVPVPQGPQHTPPAVAAVPVAEAPLGQSVPVGPSADPAHPAADAWAAQAPQAADDPAPTAEAPADQAAPAPGPSAAPAPADGQTPPAPPVPPAGQPAQPVGEFVPVEGAVPSTGHLAPTPPAPGRTEEQPDQPVAAVPAPRAPQGAADGDAALLQQADDMDTRGADAEAAPDHDPAGAGPVPDETAAPRPTGPAAPGYDDAEREAVLRVMRERRDIRNGFRSDPIPHEVLLRVLEAAHTAPSVGHSQPWDFVVIRSAETRRGMHELAMRQREAYAKSLPKGRAKQFKEMKIEAILDTPVNIVVTADPTRGGRHTLGRHTQPQMAPYSSALAVENLWLAARAEGLGVGWVSFFDEREMVRALGLPEHLEVVAYLCVGYVDEFPDEPELMQAGWSKRRPLSWVVHEETYGRRALPGEDPHDLLAETVAQIRPLDAKALGEAWERQKRMTKPAGALGMLEIISAQLSGLSRQCPPPIPEPAAVAVFAGDHGVHAQGVTPWPQEVTAQMVANFLGGGAVCNAFAAQVGAEVCVVDVGVVADLPATPGLLPRKIRAGTSDMTTGPAMTREEAKQAVEVGIETARDLVAAGNKALLTGEMGIANTTASAALISVFTGADPAEVTGRGTGINDETLVRKTDVVRRALELHQPDPADPLGVLAAVGGFEHAAMVGLLLGGASLRTPVILDGVSAGAAALVARAIAPEVLAACIAGHRSAEPGHVAALNKLGLRPLVDLDLRLGEGTGALLALPLVQSTARAMHEVATFDSAGVTEK